VGSRGLIASVRLRNEPSAERHKHSPFIAVRREEKKKHTQGGQNASWDKVVKRQDVNIASFPASAGCNVEVKVKGKATGEILSEMESRRKN